MSHDFHVLDLYSQPGIAIRETVSAVEIPAKMAEFFSERGRFVAAKAVSI